MNVYCACIYSRRLKWVLVTHEHADETRLSAATDDRELSFCSLFLYIYMKLNSGSRSWLVESFSTTVNKLKGWKGFSCMQCTETIFGEHLKSNGRTEDSRSDTYWQLSYDFDPLQHIRRLYFWKVLFFSVYFANMHFKVNIELILL